MNGWDGVHYEALIGYLVARLAVAEQVPLEVMERRLPLPDRPPVYPVPARPVEV